MPFVRRIPKRGFSNTRFKRLYHIVNVKALQARFEDGAELDVRVLAEAGIIRDTELPLKVLGEGEVSKKFNVTAAKFSASAKAKIEAAGGTVNQIVATPWTRPPKAKTADKGGGSPE